MRTVRVVVHVLNWDEKDEKAASVRCERVARFGSGGFVGEAFNPFTDEKVNVGYKLICWQEGISLPLYTVAIETLRDGLDRINLSDFKTS